MQNITKVTAVLLSSILLAGCTKATTNNPTTQTQKDAMSESQEFVKALESGKPTQCQISKDGESLTYFIKGKIMRMDSQNQMGVSHMLSTGDYLYTWEDKTKAGTKMAIDKESPSPESTESKNESFDSEQDYNYYKAQGFTVKCEPGKFDDTVFTPPSDIKFMDPSLLMQAIPSPDADGNIDISKFQEMQKQFAGTGGDN